MNSLWAFSAAFDGVSLCFRERLSPLQYLFNWAAFNYNPHPLSYCDVHQRSCFLWTLCSLLYLVPHSDITADTGTSSTVSSSAGLLYLCMSVCKVQRKRVKVGGMLELLNASPTPSWPVLDIMFFFFFSVTNLNPKSPYCALTDMKRRKIL